MVAARHAGRTPILAVEFNRAPTPRLQPTDL
jgi:hypothetical protein